MIPHDRLNDLNIEDIRSLTDGAPVADCACPICGPSRHLPRNRIRKTLRVWDDGSFVTFHCARCDADGWLKDEGAARIGTKRAATATPVPRQDTARKEEIARFLCSRSTPPSSTPVETYLRSRECWIESPALRYLPARGEYAHAMLATFGTGKITGVHITRLAPDGTAKAGTDSDKIMIGPSQGQPIIIADRPSENLIVTEGIEDAASLALVTDWSAWAAGSAGRIPHLMQATKRFKKVFIASDDDFAGRRALQRSKEIRADVIHIDCAAIFGPPSDPNSVLRSYGAYGLQACIDRRGDIALDLMMAEAA